MRGQHGPLPADVDLVTRTRGRDMLNKLLAISLLAICAMAVGCSHNGKKFDWWQFAADVLLEDDDCCCDHHHHH